MDTYIAAHRPNRGTVALAVFVLLMTVFAIPRDSVAGNRDCDTQLGIGASTTEVPQITIDVKTGTVHVATSDGHCIQGPASPMTRQSPSRKKVRISPPPVPAETPRVSVDRNQPGPRQPAAPRAACDKAVGEMWTSGVHEVGGVSAWVHQVHTIDLGGDGRIDNVGFRMRPPEGEDMVLTYFAAAGRMSAKSVPGLALADDSMIARLCFGQATYEAPKSLIAELEREGPFKLPDIAQEMAESKKPREGDDADGFMGIWMGIASGAPLGLAVGGIGAYLMRRKRRAEAAEGEEGDEDEEA